MFIYQTSQFLISIKYINYQFFHDFVFSRENLSNESNCFGVFIKNVEINQICLYVTFTNAHICYFHHISQRVERVRFTSRPQTNT